MKKYIQRIIVCVMIVSLYSCEELVNQVEYEGPDYVRFELTAGSAIESGGTISIPVITNRSGEFSVDFSVSSESAVEGVDFNFVNSSNTLSFPDGVFSDTVFVQLIDNDAADGAKELVITLSNPSNDVQVAFDNDIEGFGAFELSIGDDDCPLDLDAWVGTWSVFETDGSDEFNYTIEATLGGNTNTLLIDNFWGSGLPAEITFDNSDPSNPIAYVLPQNTGVVLNPAGVTWVTSRPDPDASGSSAARGGLPDGSFSTCDETFEVSIVIYIPAAGTFAPAVSHTFSR